MSAPLALLDLYDRVVASMAAEALAADVEAVPHSLGWREPARQGLSSRITWVPGDGSRAGTIGAPMHPQTSTGRRLASFPELFTVYVTAFDASDPENERLQYQATRLLFDAWYRHCYRAATTNFSVSGVSWVTDKSTRRHGATLAVSCQIQGAIPDLDLTYLDHVDVIENDYLEETEDPPPTEIPLPDE